MKEIWSAYVDCQMDLKGDCHLGILRPMKNMTRKLDINRLKELVINAEGGDGGNSGLGSITGGKGGNINMKLVFI